MAKRVLVIGGGIAGMAFAQTLLEKAKDAVEITVVTKDPFYMTGPSRPLLLTKEQRYERMIRGYEEPASQGINFVFGTVKRIDPAERIVEGLAKPPGTRGYIVVECPWPRPCGLPGPVEELRDPTPRWLRSLGVAVG